MKYAYVAAVLTTLASTAYAHMEMSNPAPFRGKSNKNADPGKVDFSMTSPLQSAQQFPCKGYHSDFGTPQGAPTASYEAGSQQTLSIIGGAAHNGGSCQVSLSYDNGATFKVIQSIIGGCVNPAGPGDFPFTIPADAKSGDAILAWTWFNNTGVREIYMNCAAVTITGSGTSTLADRPDIFVANLPNTTCKVPDGSDVIFPNPGPNVVQNETGKTAAPTGECGPVGAAPPAAPPANPDTPATPPAAPPATEPVPPPGTGAPVPPAPPATGVSYTVVSGDTCEAIAAKSGTTTTDLMAKNPGVDAGCTNLAVGQVLSLRRRSRIMRDYA